jgi:transcriptional regulator with XRE-family HTH domain
VEYLDLDRRIRAWRKAAGLTQRELAALVGVSSMTVCYWETARTQPTPENIERVANACGVSVRIFFGALPPEPQDDGRAA